MNLPEILYKKETEGFNSYTSSFSRICYMYLYDRERVIYRRTSQEWFANAPERMPDNESDDIIGSGYVLGYYPESVIKVYTTPCSIDFLDYKQNLRLNDIFHSKHWSVPQKEPGFVVDYFKQLIQLMDNHEVNFQIDFPQITLENMADVRYFDSNKAQDYQLRIQERVYDYTFTLLNGDKNYSAYVMVDKRNEKKWFFYFFSLDADKYTVWDNFINSFIESA